MLIVVKLPDGTDTTRRVWEVEKGDEVLGVSPDNGRTFIEFRESQLRVSSKFDITIEPRSPNLIDIRTGGPEE